MSDVEAHRLSDEKRREMIDDTLNRLHMSSNHGPNCRHCNIHPSLLRRVWWRIEDFVNTLRYGREPKEQHMLCQYLGKKHNDE